MSLSGCFARFHLILLASLVLISLTLIGVGGSISAWCVNQGNIWQCHSLFYSDQTFSCLFKVIPAAIIFCLILSLLMFVILISLQVYRKYSEVSQKEYRYVVRLVNVLALSVSIVLIMIVLLQWFHSPSHTSKDLIIAIVSKNNVTQKEQAEFKSLAPSDPGYLEALATQRESTSTRRYQINHGPNLFVGAFFLLFIALLAFVTTHRLTN